MTTTITPSTTIVDLTTSPPRITKRKLDEAFRILDDAVSAPEPAERPSPPKRSHTTRSIYSTLVKYGIRAKEPKQPAFRETEQLSEKTPTLNAILSRTATRTKNALKLFKSPAPVPVLPPTAEYRPSSIPAFLSRLATFKLATYASKPTEIDAVAAAKCGWVNDGKDRLVCGLCNVSWVLASREGMTRDGAAALIEKQRVGLVEMHKNGCPWKTRQCDDSIYRIPLRSPSVTVRDIKANALALEAMVEGIEIKHPLSATQLKTLRGVVENYELPIPDESMPDAMSIDPHKQPSDTAMLTTLFGWSIAPPVEPTRKSSLSRASSVGPTAPSISRASTPGPSIAGLSISAFTFRMPSLKMPARDKALLYCSLCQRRVGLWAFTALSTDQPASTPDSMSASPPNNNPATPDALAPILSEDAQATSISAPPTFAHSSNNAGTPPPALPSISVANYRPAPRRKPTLTQRHFDLLIEHRPHCPYVVKSTIVPSLPVPPSGSSTTVNAPPAPMARVFSGPGHRRSASSMSVNTTGSYSGGRIGSDPIEGWRAVLTVALRYGLGKRRSAARGLSWDLPIAEEAGEHAAATANASNTPGAGSASRGEAVDDDMEVDNITAMVDGVKSRGGRDLLRYVRSLLG